MTAKKTYTNPDTILAVAGRDPDNNFGIVNPPVYHASTILSPTMEKFENRIPFEGFGYGRIDAGAAVQLADGQGSRAIGAVLRIAKRNATVQVDRIEQLPPPAPVHLLLPIADKDRMLWLAEKAAELGATSWRPVQYRRSRSVAARGEGTVFTQKVAARMQSALEQSRNAWLPTIYPEATLDRAIAAKIELAAALGEWKQECSNSNKTISVYNKIIVINLNAVS